MTIEEIKTQAENMGFMLVERLPYYTIDSLARRIAGNRRTIEKWVAGNKLPFVKVGKRVKFDFNEIERRLASGKLLND